MATLTATKESKKLHKVIKISDIIIPKYYKIFNDWEHEHIILTSGRAGTKSSYSGIKEIWTIIQEEPAAVVVMRKHHNKLRKTVFKETIRAINRLGLNKEKDFRITKSPMQITYKKNGNTIYFTGSDSVDDTKGIIDEDRPIKLVVLDELTEFFDDGEGEDEISNIEATFVRGNDEEFQMLYLYNPPKNPNAPIVEWCHKMEQREDTVHIHSTYMDVPISWVGKKLVKSAEAMKAIDEKLYNWVWLGLSTGIDELIYYMFNQSHIVSPIKQKYHIGIGVDYGQMNATTYQAFGLDQAKRKFKGLKEYYYSGRDTGKQKSPSEYADDFKSFYEELVEDYNASAVYVFIDPSARGLAEEIKRKCPRVKIVPADNDVALGISRVQKLITYGILEVSPEQKNLIREFGLYEYDKKSIEAGKEVPVKTNDHGMDALRYNCMGMWKYLKWFLPVAVRDDYLQKARIDISNDAEEKKYNRK